MIDLIEIIKALIGIFLWILINYFLLKWEKWNKFKIWEVIINWIFLFIYVFYVIYWFVTFLDLFYPYVENWFIFFIYSLLFFVLIPYLFFIIKRKILKNIGIKISEYYILFSYIYILIIPIILYMLWWFIFNLFY